MYGPFLFFVVFCLFCFVFVFRNISVYYTPYYEQQFILGYTPAIAHKFESLVCFPCLCVGVSAV